MGGMLHSQTRRVSLPAELPWTGYGMVMLNTKPPTLALRDFRHVGKAGQAVLRRTGFDPVGLIAPAPRCPDFLSSAPARFLTCSLSNALSASWMTLACRFPDKLRANSRFQEWTGPRLWDVLRLPGWLMR